MKVALVYWSLLLLMGCQTTKKSNEEVEKANVPKLLKPDVRKLWVPAEIQDGGRVYIEGHWRYEMQRSTSFGR